MLSDNDGNYVYIVNAKNEMVMNAMLSNLGQTTGALFGPQAAPALIKALQEQG